MYFSVMRLISDVDVAVSVNRRRMDKHTLHEKSNRNDVIKHQFLATCSHQSEVLDSPVGHWDL